MPDETWVAGLSLTLEEAKVLIHFFSATAALRIGREKSLNDAMHAISEFPGSVFETLAGKMGKLIAVVAEEQERRNRA
jgi:hypothetical protein